MGPELQNYLDRINDLRRMVSEIVADLPAEALNWRPLPEGQDEAVNSLAVLVAHVAGAEHFWVGEVIGGRPSTRNRPAEFETRVSGAEELLKLLAAAGIETQEVLSRLEEPSLAETRQVENRTVTVRWALLHVVDHSSLHLGHMQITRQLWAGGKAVPTPFWYQRLPSERKQNPGQSSG